MGIPNGGPVPTLRVGWNREAVMGRGTRIGGTVTLGLLLLLPAAGSLNAQPADAGPVTFSRDIAPILQRSCENCHRSDGVAPMSLVTYEEVRPWARAIKQRTGLGPKA